MAKRSARRVLVWTLALTGLCGGVAAGDEAANPVFRAMRVAARPGLDDDVWRRAPAYPLRPIPVDGRELADAGTARFAWDDDFLYMAVACADRDVVALGATDGDTHYQLGDVIELFLHYGPEPYYWELHATPAGRRSAYFYRSGGLRIASLARRPEARPEVAVVVEGSLNAHDDTDGGFRMLMAVPTAELRRLGAAWGPGASWRVLVGRYNFGRHLPATEYSASATLTRTNFHDLAAYGVLELQP